MYALRQLLHVLVRRGVRTRMSQVAQEIGQTQTNIIDTQQFSLVPSQQPISLALADRKYRCCRTSLNTSIHLRSRSLIEIQPILRT